MADRDTNSASNKKGRSRRGRWVGFVLLVVAFILGPVSVFVFAMNLIGLGLGTEIGPWLAFLPLFGMLFSPILVLWGWFLAAGRKELILFLRRFGNEALNDAVRDLVQTRLRRRFRLVTLDDSVFPPAGPRWSGLLVSLLPAAAILVGILLSYAGFARTAQSELMDETPFGTALVMLQLGMIALGVLAFIVCLLLAIIAIRSHFTARRTIDGPEARKRVIRRLRRLRTLVRAPSMAAPMATVITTSDAQWQPTIKAIVPLCAVVLLDLSSPSENICWELESVLTLGVRTIVLARHDSYCHWWNADAHGDEALLWSRLRALAEGLPLVVYETPGRLGQTPLMDMLQAHCS